MHSANCPHCDQCFSRRDAMLRHQKHKHNAEELEQKIVFNEASPPPPPPPPEENKISPKYDVSASVYYDDFGTYRYLFKYIFNNDIYYQYQTCGKTTFVTNLLQHHNTRIQPSVHRIVWLFKRWQPLYSIIKNTVLPKVEFVQGIPNDLADDDFFDPRINNLLILDDLFSEAGKDKLDRQSLMTLARQMYPGHTDKVMNAFAKATKYPYGYLLVDLKPFTAEDDRLKYDLKLKCSHFIRDYNKLSQLTNRVPERLDAIIKENDMSKLHHSTVGVQTVHIDDQEEAMAEKGQACDDCGLLFDSAHNVQRHVTRGWCPETRETMGEPPVKRRRTEEQSDDAMEDDIEENDGFLHLWEIAHKENKDKFNNSYDQYIDDGYNEEDSYEMASERTQPYKERLFFANYQRLLERYWLTYFKTLVYSKTYTSLYAFSGQEFKAKRVQDLMRKFDKLYRYFNHKDNYNNISVLQNIADSYNNTYHRTIDMQPADVKENNQEEVRLATYFAQNPKRKKLMPNLKPFKFKIGTYVRISHLKTVFTRAYDQTYSGEIFRVYTRYHRGILPIYRLQDLQGDGIKGIFYESELQKVHVDAYQTWKVENVLKRRGKGRNKQYFVKWKYYP
ncbi:hypothetical protein MAR_036703 [Mya arenaria]|uniref:C2H2-type domain-containing protein n=1 Tax=Mya arenaria TaxID=6604 RepID=A0ABY7FPF1_MYAAR|nr:hypothetical protein MAR_036703 [Mya arenaria]